MRLSWQKLALIALASAGVVVVEPALVAAQAGAPVTTPAQGLRRPGETVSPAQKLQTELANTFRAIGPVFSDREVLTSAEKRAEKLPEIQTQIAKVRELASQLAEIEPRAAAMKQQLDFQTDTILLAFGDPSTQQNVEQAAAGEGVEAQTAHLKQAITQLIQNAAGSDARSQAWADLSKAIGEDTANPLGMVAMTMAAQMAGEGETDELLALAKSHPSEMARQMVVQIEAEMKMAAMEGKPLVITGQTVNGEQFSSAQYKGKVVLIDFWATWCGPCVAELPELKKLYAEYHSQGLEIIGVSNDQTDKAVKDFLARNPDMPWVQLWEQPSTPNGWHRISREMGVSAIPRYFLIDRNGVLNTVNARGKLETLIPKLLGEKQTESASAE